MQVTLNAREVRLGALLAALIRAGVPARTSLEAERYSDSQHYRLCLRDTATVDGVRVLQTRIVQLSDIDCDEEVLKALRALAAPYAPLEIALGPE